MAVKEIAKDDIARHVKIWAAIREYTFKPLPNGRHAVLRTDRPAGTWEYVGFEPTKEEFDTSAATVLEDKRRILTVIGKDMTQYRELATAHGFDILAQEALMTLDLSGLSPVAASENTASFVKEIDTAETGIATRCRVIVTTSKEDGSKPAASGQVGVQGDMAVFDQIKTEENMRRKGLGSLVMRTLGTEAYARGAKTGWLIGTPEGQLLYERLGWKHGYYVLLLGNKEAIANP